MKRILERATSKLDFDSTNNLTDIVVDKLIKYLSIRKGTYVFDPELGTELHKVMFNQSDLVTYQVVKSEIQHVLSSLGNEATLEDLKISISSDKKSMIIEIYIIVNTTNERKVITLYTTNDYMNVLGVS